MEEIDKPLRPKRDFFIVWALLAAAAFLLTRQHDFGPWYSYNALVIVISLFAVFVLYGPVLLMRQIIRSGSRGWFVLRLFLSIVMAAALLFGGLLVSGFYTTSNARVLAFVFVMGSAVYLQWRTEKW